MRDDAGNAAPFGGNPGGQEAAHVGRQTGIITALKEVWEGSEGGLRRQEERMRHDTVNTDPLGFISG